MEPDKDTLLLSELREGKSGAFQQIYEVYWEDLFIYVSRVLGEESDAEDIVQEVFVNLWRIKDNVSHINSLKAYLLKMAKNRVVKFLMKKQHTKECSASLHEYLQESQENLEQRIIVNELSAIIDSEIAALPTKMRQIFLLSRKDCLFHKEIASMLEISDQTVKKQINNSIKYLKTRLKHILSIML